MYYYCNLIFAFTEIVFATCSSILRYTHRHTHRICSQLGLWLPHIHLFILIFSWNNASSCFLFKDPHLTSVPSNIQLCTPASYYSLQQQGNIFGSKLCGCGAGPIANLRGMSDVQRCFLVAAGNSMMQMCTVLSLSPHFTRTAHGHFPSFLCITTFLSNHQLGLVLDNSFSVLSFQTLPPNPKANQTETPQKSLHDNCKQQKVQTGTKMHTNPNTNKKLSYR